MKKLMIAAAAAFCGTVCFGELASANVVGYNSVKIKGDRMNLLTVSWESIGSADNKANLKDVMSTEGLTSYTAEMVAGDYIDTWDMENGNWGATYYYIDLPEFGLADQWIDGSLSPAEILMNSGSSFWLFHKGEDIPALAFKGQVSTATTGYTLTGGRMNLCGNPYPTSLDLNASAGQVTITGATSYTAEMVPGDYIDTWDLVNSNWGATYYYINLPEFGLADQWIDGSLSPAKTDIQPGAGFWYYAKNPGTTLTFTKLAD